LVRKSLQSCSKRSEIMIQIGEIPNLDFSIKRASGGVLGQSLFSDLIDRPIVVSVFMRANTGSCDKQIVSLGVVQDDIEKRSVGLIGVSRDTAPALNRYGAKHEIAFPLVSDPKFQFAEAVDSMVEKKMYGKTFLGPTRSAYLFDRAGKLLDRIESVDPSRHGEEVLELLDKNGV